MKELTVIDERIVLDREFRIYGTKENPLFLAKDVAEFIEYNKDKVGQMLSKVDDEEKVTLPIYYSGQVRNMYFLTEDGLYEVLMQSRKPIAKEFKKEVKNILKTIRQTGGYIPIEDGMSDSEIMARALVIANNTIAKKDELIQRQNEQLEEQQPKVEGYDMFLNTSGLTDWNTVAKNFGIGRNTILKNLREIGVLMDNNIPYQRYAKHFEVKFKTVQRGTVFESYPVALVKPSGQEFLLKTLRKHGLVK